MPEQWNEPNLMSPPVEGGPLEEKPTTWPTVLGVLGIIWASLGLFCGCVGLFQVPLQRWGAEMQASAGQSNALAEAQLRVAEQFQVVMWGLIGVGFVFAIILLMGSINLIRRRRKAKSLLMTWAMASLLMLALNVALQVMMYQATAAELNKAGDQSQIGQLWISAIIGGVMAIFFGLLPPVFLLIWFARERIKREVDQWP